MKPKTNKERQKAYVERQKSKGKQKLSIYAKPEHHEKIKGYANKLEKGVIYE